MVGAVSPTVCPLLRGFPCDLRQHASPHHPPGRESQSLRFGRGQLAAFSVTRNGAWWGHPSLAFGSAAPVAFPETPEVNKRGGGSAGEVAGDIPGSSAPSVTHAPSVLEPDVTRWGNTGVGVLHPVRSLIHSNMGGLAERTPGCCGRLSPCVCALCKEPRRLVSHGQVALAPGSAVILPSQRLPC